MDAKQILAQLLAEEPNTAALSQPLADECAETVIAGLKEAVDRNWFANAWYSVRLAEFIIEIGQRRSDLKQIALGVMARGDSLRYVGKLGQAWEDLLLAGELYQEAGNDFGWARTCIGRLALCVDLNQVERALADAEQARQIFQAHQDTDRVIRLNLNTATVYNRLGHQERALVLYQEALKMAQTLGAAGEFFIGILYTNLGYTYLELGQVQQALYYHQQAQCQADARAEARSSALARLNIAYVQQMGGHYREALYQLHQVQDVTAAALPLEHALARRMMVECYLSLSRFEEAAELARGVAEDYTQYGAVYEKALTLRYLATALAALALYEAAAAALQTAEQIFIESGALTRVARLQIEQGYLKLRAGDLAGARALAEAAYATFVTTHERVYLAEAALLQGAVDMEQQAWQPAQDVAQHALAVARAARHPPLRYSAHLLLGRIYEARQQRQRAMRHYQAAHLTVERMQCRLTVTLRTGFLTNKLDAIRAQMRLLLEEAAPERAFLTLERMKAQVLFSYLTRQENLRWVATSASSARLIDELDHLRAEHQWFYQRLHGDWRDEAPKTGHSPAYSAEQLAHELAEREKRMRAITERLYLENDSATQALALPNLEAMQQALTPDQLMIAYYNDGRQLWAFTLSQMGCQVVRLPAPLAEIDRLIQQFQFNIDCALTAGPGAPVIAGLTAIGQKLGQRLYALLVAPLALPPGAYQRLTIVPYGSLHYVPFHLLSSPQGRLIETYELVILPTAGQITQRSPQRAPGALALAHSWADKLPHVLAEAQGVYGLFGGQVMAEAAATRRALAATPCQILHIAAHGEYRMDHPELSFIQLADGQVYTDDLWQHNLSYELVTLSACETGRANVMAGEELIGLGRGFLYAGAGALIASLWRVPDAAAHDLMMRVYAELRGGASKAAALRRAQLALLADQPQQHPAFWGAFQLIGDARPLSA